MIAITSDKEGADGALLTEELYAALEPIGARDWSLSVRGAQVIVLLRDNATAEQIDAVRAAISAHPTKAESALMASRRQADEARAALSVQNFKQLRQDIIDASTLAALKIILVKLLRLIYYLAAAQTLNGDDPG